MNWPKVILLALLNCSLGKSIDIFTWCPRACLPKRNWEPVVPGGSSSYGLTYIFRTTYQTSLFWPITLFQIRVGDESGVPALAKLCTVFLVANWTPQMPQASLGYSIEAWITQSSSLIQILKSLRTQSPSDWLTLPMMIALGIYTLSGFALASFQLAWAPPTESPSQVMSFTSRS
jgi:hypothetical protein